MPTISVSGERDTRTILLDLPATTGSRLGTASYNAHPMHAGTGGVIRDAAVAYRADINTNHYGSNVHGERAALEAALDVAGEPGSRVTLAYRGKAFDRVKPKNRARLEQAMAEGRIDLRLGTTVGEIGIEHVSLINGDASELLDKDQVIVCAGGELPTPLLKKIGVQVDTHYGD